MSKSKRFIAVMVATSAIALSVLAAFQVSLDRYRVFNAIGGDYSTYYARIDEKPEFNHNDRFTPMAYLLSEPHTFDRFVLGSSNVNSLDAAALGPGWYKLNYNDATLEEHLHNLEILFERREVQEVIVAIDDRTFRQSGTNLHYKSMIYPRDPFDWVYLMASYLLKAVDEKDLRMFFGVDYALEEVRPYYLRVAPAARLDLDHARDPEFFRKGLRRMQGLPHRGYSEEKVAAALVTIAKMKELAESNGAMFRLFFQPMHYKNVYHLDYRAFNELKIRIAEVTDFHDFTAPHNYIFNNVFWKELVHYFRGVNDEIVRHLNGMDTRCPGFGVLLTSQNARRLTDRMRAESTIVIPHIEARDPNFRPDPGLREIAPMAPADARAIEARLLDDCLRYYPTPST